jgi:ribonucleoside-triphosphate reductase
MEFALKILKEINDFAESASKNLGMRLVVAQRPQDEASSRLAKLDMARYGPGQVATEGIRDYPYYTDLFVVPLAAKIDLHQRIALESKFQEQSLGGHLTPIYLAPKEQDPKELLHLTEQACQNHLRFFTYTTNFSYCQRCNKTSLGIAS